jgi:hypothetical protein
MKINKLKQNGYMPKNHRQKMVNATNRLIDDQEKRTTRPYCLRGLPVNFKKKVFL